MQSIPSYSQTGIQNIAWLAVIQIVVAGIPADMGPGKDKVAVAVQVPVAQVYMAVAVVGVVVA
jgi:hypothetical protein